MRVGEEYQAVVPDLITGKCFWVFFLNCVNFLAYEVRTRKCPWPECKILLQNTSILSSVKILGSLLGTVLLYVAVEAKFRFYLEIELNEYFMFGIWRSH